MKTNFLCNALSALLIILSIGCRTGTRKEEWAEVNGKSNQSYQAEIEEIQKSEKSTEIVFQKDHSGQITCIRFFPDRELILTASEDNTFKLWNREGKILRTVYTDIGIRDCKISNDATSIFIGGGTGLMQFDLFGNKKNELKTAHNQSNVDIGLWSFDISPDGRHLVYSNNLGHVYLSELSGKRISDFQAHNGMLWKVLFSPSGDFFVTGGADTKIKFWDLRGNLIREIDTGDGEIGTLEFSSSGKFLASVSMPSWDSNLNKMKGKDILKIWSADGKLQKEIQLSSTIYSIKFTPDEKFLIGGEHGKKKLHTWSLSGNSSSVFSKGHFPGESMTKVDISPDGKYVISSSLNYLQFPTMTLWTRTGERLENFQPSYPTILEAIDIQPDKSGFITGDIEGKIRIWSGTGKLTKLVSGQKKYLESLRISPDGQTFISGSDVINIHNRDGEIRKKIKGHKNGTTNILFTKDGEKFITSGADGRINVWTKAGDLLSSFAAHKERILSMTISPDEKTLVTGSSFGEIKFWNLDGTLLKKIKSHGDYVDIYGLDYSPDGKYIASAGVYQVIIRDTNGTTINAISTKHTMTNVGQIAFSPDGKTIAISENNSLLLSDLSGNISHKLKGPMEIINSFRYTPDGKNIIAVSRDGLTTIWNVETGNSMILASRNNEWIAWTSDGYFDASPKGGELVNIVTGFTAWGIDQFAYKFNRPDLILERAGMGNKTLLTHYFNRFKKRLNRAGLSESDVNSEMDVPTATIIAHSVVKDVANLRIGLQDEKYSIRNYNIYVNDVPLFGSKGKKTDGTKVFIEEQFQLTPGKNKIEVTCLNSRGAESLRSLVYLFSSYTPKEKGDLYYLGFGVSRYKNTELNLQFADKDAKDLAGVFGGFEKKSFSGFHSRIYLNEEATVENVRKAKEFLKNAKPADTVVLFIAGHGLHDRDKESTYYFLTHETDLTKLADTAAKFELIEEILQEIAPRNKLFLIDTCESGETEDETVSRNLITAKSRGLSPRTIRSINVIAKGKSPDKPRTFLFETDRYIYNDLLRRSGAVVFSSSKGGEFSYESAEIQNGFFTSELIHALRNRKADRNGDGIISTDELKAIVIQEVSKKTNGLQNPTVDKDNIYQKFGF